MQLCRKISRGNLVEGKLYFTQTAFGRDKNFPISSNTKFRKAESKGLFKCKTSPAGTYAPHYWGSYMVYILLFLEWYCLVFNKSFFNWCELPRVTYLRWAAI